MPLGQVSREPGFPSLLGRAGRPAHVRLPGQQMLPGSQLDWLLSPRRDELTHDEVDVPLR